MTGKDDIFNGFPPLKPEIRLLIAYYLIFLFMILGFGVGDSRRSISVMALEDLKPYYQESEKHYDLRGLVQRADDELEKVLVVQGITVKEKIWRFREKTGVGAVVWTETEIIGRGEDDPELKKDLLKNKLDTAFAPYHIVYLSSKGIQLGADLHYQFTYGMELGGVQFVTHRVSVVLTASKIPTSPPTNVIPILRKPDSQSQDSSAPRPVVKPQGKPEVSKDKSQPSQKRSLTPIIEPPLIRDERPRKKARVAIIIDDFGFVKDGAEAYFTIREPLTIAVLPGGKYSREHAIKGAQAGFEVILHQPLEPLDSRNDPGPGLIGSFHSDEEMIRQFRANLEDVPGAVGFNNHMGSKGTQDLRVMKMLLSEAKQMGIFFIDSRSISRSIGEKAAREVGVPHAGRDIFLDHYGVNRVKEQLDQLAKVALRRGEAIGIAHARPGVAEIIAAYLPTFKEAGIELVHASKLLKAGE